MSLARKFDLYLMHNTSLMARGSSEHHTLITRMREPWHFAYNKEMKAVGPEFQCLGSLKFSLSGYVFSYTHSNIRTSIYSYTHAFIDSYIHTFIEANKETRIQTEELAASSSLRSMTCLSVSRNTQRMVHSFHCCRSGISSAKLMRPASKKSQAAALFGTATSQHLLCFISQRVSLLPSKPPGATTSRAFGSSSRLQPTRERALQHGSH